MENLQKKPLFVLEEGVVESEVRPLPKLKELLRGLMVGRAGGRRKLPFLVIRVNGCWDWVSRLTTNGYGCILWNEKFTRAHRLVYEGLVGPIQPELTIDHLCKNKLCCNPVHLEQVTLTENLRRSNNASSVNRRKTHCIRGHELSGENLKMNNAGERRCRKCKVMTNKLFEQRRRKK